MCPIYLFIGNKNRQCRRSTSQIVPIHSPQCRKWRFKFRFIITTPLAENSLPFHLHLTANRRFKRPIELG